MEIGSLYKNMGIRGTYQVSRESIECAKNFKHLGRPRESKAVRDLIGELNLLQLRNQTQQKIFAIDTGSRYSGYCHFQIARDGIQPYLLISHGVVENSDLIKLLVQHRNSAIVMENFQSMGMAVGKTVFESCIWLGRFVETARRSNKDRPVFFMHRTTAKLEICGQSRAKDSNVRQAIIDIFTGVEDGGKVPQIGTKKNQGPLYGVKSHVWSALAVGISLDKLMSIY